MEHHMSWLDRSVPHAQHSLDDAQLDEFERMFREAYATHVPNFFDTGHDAESAALDLVRALEEAGRLRVLWSAVALRGRLIGHFPSDGAESEDLDAKVVEILKCDLIDVEELDDDDEDGVPSCDELSAILFPKGGDQDAGPQVHRDHDHRRRLPSDEEAGFSTELPQALDAGHARRHERLTRYAAAALSGLLSGGFGSASVASGDHEAVAREAWAYAEALQRLEPVCGEGEAE